jgi:hypothetical protein
VHKGSQCTGALYFKTSLLPKFYVAEPEDEEEECNVQNDLESCFDEPSRPGLGVRYCKHPEYAKLTCQVIGKTGWDKSAVPIKPVLRGPLKEENKGLKVSFKSALQEAPLFSEFKDQFCLGSEAILTTGPWLPDLASAKANESKKDNTLKVNKRRGKQKNATAFFRKLFLP